MLQIRERDEKGNLLPLKKVFGGETLEEKAARLENENLSNMLAMTDLFETNVRLHEENNQLMLAVTDLFEMVIGGNA